MTQVITVNGNTYTFPDDFAGYAYTAALPAFVADLLADAGKALCATSATAHSVGPGTKTFLLETDVPFAVGAFVVVAVPADPAKWMHGQVTAKAGASLTIAVTAANGVGTGPFSAWNITVAGPVGATGLGLPTPAGISQGGKLAEVTAAGEGYRLSTYSQAEQIGLMLAL